MNYYLLPDPPYSDYDSYIKSNGPSAVLIARSLSPPEIVNQITRSGLRGRGGAGFPAGLKWKTILNHPCPKRYVVCNAAEGEPGTYKDRYLLRRNPYLVLEGLAIAARAGGARASYIVLKETFDHEIGRVVAAAAQMAYAGVLRDRPMAMALGPDLYLLG